ncbi:MAG: glycosyltransferase family 4 protein [Planctomycetes bacterium]|nr:glycosyltransferase family 4 protein [Planctomycetota bacterium]
MKLLFLTQVLDAGDAVLGFVPRWVEALAARVERVRVVALEVGDTAGLPANVDWREIGRRGVLRRYWRYRRVLGEALGPDGYDAVLAHMVPRYALLAQGPARRHGARVYLWYTHAAVDARLVRASNAVEKVFTASAESLRIDTPRRVVTGHGIDLRHFGSREEGPADPPRILAVGRLTPAKDPLTVIEAVRLLVAAGRDLRLDLVGGGLTVADKAYGERVRQALARSGLGERVALAGEVAYRDVPRWYERASVVVNASFTGSIDKVVLEAMASRRPFVSCNEAVPPLVGALGGRERALAFEKGDAADLARRIAALLDLPPMQRAELGEELRAIVARDHEVERLAGRLVAEMAGGRP